MKERQSSNGIYELKNNQGEALTKVSDIQEEIHGFYKKYSRGAPSGVTVGINKALMRNGPQLNV